MIQDVTAQIQGECDERYAGVRKVLEDNLNSGADLGASVAVFVDGEPVVDVWGGWTDQSRTTPWARDTLVTVYPTTKPMPALWAVVLADAGELDFNARVSTYGRESAAGGRAGVGVRPLLPHTAGLSGWAAPMEPADL